jgi:hypothetical protein
VMRFLFLLYFLGGGTMSVETCRTCLPDRTSIATCSLHKQQYAINTNKKATDQPKQDV